MLHLQHNNYLNYVTSYHMISFMMRRKDREMRSEEALELLKKCEYGILSLVDEDNSPYALPLSFAVVDRKIYIHGALEGKKLDVLQKNSSVCFVAVGKTHVLPQKFSTEYESVIVMGNGYIAKSDEEKTRGLLALVEKYSPSFLKEGDLYIQRAIQKTAVFVINIESITGKKRE